MIAIEINSFTNPLIGNKDMPQKIEAKEKDNESKDSGSSEKEESSSMEIFSEIPEEFVFSSGSGAWRTYITISPKGEFVGEFSNWDSMPVRDDAPNGVTQKCPFKGAFKDVEKVNDFEYTLKIDYLETTGTGGQEVVDGLVIETLESVPYGFEEAEDFILYLPGRETADLDPTFLSWISSPQGWSETPSTLPLYALFNVGGATGFCASSEGI